MPKMKKYQILQSDVAERLIPINKTKIFLAKSVENSEA